MVASTWKSRMSKVSDEILDTSIRDLGGVITDALRSVTTELGLGIDIRVKGKSVNLGTARKGEE